MFHHLQFKDIRGEIQRRALGESLETPCSQNTDRIEENKRWCSTGGVKLKRTLGISTGPVFLGSQKGQVERARSSQAWMDY
jgi:hypothetical protein